MNSYVIWTASHVTAAILLLNIIFAPGVALYMVVKDKHGPVIFGQPPREWLRLVREHPRPWFWATFSFMSAMLLTMVGLDLLAGLLRAAGDPGFAGVGLLMCALGAVLWVVILAARLSVEPWAGKELAATDSIPDVYTALARWNGALFVIFTILFFAGMVLFGTAILVTGLLPPWLGWATILYSLAGLAVLAITRDSLPAMHHLMPLVIGIVMLSSS